MDADESSACLKGLRRKWRKTSHGNVGDATSHVESVDDDVHVVSHDCPGVSSSIVPPGSDVQSVGAFALPDSLDLGFGPQPQHEDASTTYEPAFAPTTDVELDVGGMSSFADDNAAVSDLFIRKARLANITLGDTFDAWNFWRDRAEC